MATMKLKFLSVFFLFLVLFLPGTMARPISAGQRHGSRPHPHPHPAFNHHPVLYIYQFGDSLSDTGNLIRDSPAGASSTFSRLPYGISFHHQATGRCSDGLLMIDFIAMHYRLPLLDPYLKKDGNFNHGVNFAVAGSTALDSAALAQHHVYNPATNSSLSVQLEWFRSHLNSICSDPTECKAYLQNALFMVGETGGNDINYALLQQMPMDVIQNTLVPEVMQAIKDAVEEVIRLGATRIVVPGNFAIGCMPIYLANFQTNDASMYDDLKCLKGLNEFAMFQNNQLQQAIRELQVKHPHVKIVYADYYNALRGVLQHARQLGFDEEARLTTCCGSGNNDYNFNITGMCGYPQSTVCPNPHRRVHWDGVHLTQHAYSEVAKNLLKAFKF